MSEPTELLEKIKQVTAQFLSAGLNQMPPEAARMVIFGMECGSIEIAITTTIAPYGLRCSCSVVRGDEAHEIFALDSAGQLKLVEQPAVIN